MEQGEYKDVTENLRKLKGLSEDDISEAGLLKSRIEQQSELICILKQRADEYLKKYIEIENKTANIRNEMSESFSKYDVERKSHEILKDRFKTLDQNHVEMIKLKDEYKQENEKLRHDNLRLKDANENMFSEEITRKGEEIAKLNQELKGFQTKLEQANEKERDLIKQLAEVKEKNERQMNELKRAENEEKTQRTETLKILEEKYSVAQKELTALQNALEESDTQKQILQDAFEEQIKASKENEIKVNELQRQLETEKERVKYLEHKVKKENESLTTNSTIRRLTVENQEAKQLKMKLVREFDAYKKHTSRLLDRERELNANLRRLNIP